MKKKKKNTPKSKYNKNTQKQNWNAKKLKSKKILGEYNHTINETESKKKQSKIRRKVSTNK